MTPQKSFSFSIRMSNPESRRFQDIKASRPDADAWTADPQPDGVWIHGKTGIPQGMLESLQELLVRSKTLDELTFTYADPSTNTGGMVMVTAEGYTDINLADHVHTWTDIARDAIRNPDAEDRPTA